MNKWKKSVFYQLTLAFLGFGLLPLCIAGMVLYLQFKGNMEQVMLQDMTHMVSYAGKNLDELVEDCNRLTKIIYDVNTEDGRLLCSLLKDDTVSPYQARMQVNVMLKRVLDGDSRVRSAYFLDRRGGLYYATGNTQKVLNEGELRRWLDDRPGTEGGLMVYPTHTDDYFPHSNNQVITFARPYKDVSSMKTVQDVLGTVYVDVDVSKVASILQDVDMGGQGTFRVVDGEGVCIYSQKREETGHLAGDLPAFGKMEGERGTVTDRDGYHIYTSVRGCGWKAVASVKKASVMAHVDVTKRNILLFLAASFFVLVMLYLYFYKKIRRPVEELKAGMRAIQKGDLSVRVDIRREDELGMLAGGLNQMAEELQEYIKKVYVAEIKQREAELDALKSQIKPHYLYNTLDVIRMMALEHEDGETAAMVGSLSRQLKYLMGYHSDIVPLKMEIDNIREYFVIMRVRYENRISLEVSVDEAVMERGIIKLSLQPIVENAVKHGLRPKKGQGTVRVEARECEGALEIVVLDDGVGMDEDTLKRLTDSLGREEIGVQTETGWKHVGLKNAYDRIRKNFGEAYGLEVFSTKGVGTIVVYRLPLIDGTFGNQEK